MLGYFEDGPNLVALAVNAWADAEPAWWLNLQAHPDANVELQDGSRPVRARAAEGEERARLWARWRELGDRSGETLIAEHRQVRCPAVAPAGGRGAGAPTAADGPSTSHRAERRRRDEPVEGPGRHVRGGVRHPGLPGHRLHPRGRPERPGVARAHGEAQRLPLPGPGPARPRAQQPPAVGVDRARSRTSSPSSSRRASRRGGRASSASPGAARSSTPCWTAIPTSSTGRSSMARPRSSRREAPGPSWPSS